MPTIPTKLCEAFEKIRLGKVDEGTRLFDRVDGCEPIKSFALAELAYFRHDWKRGMAFARDFFESDQDWETVRHIITRYKDLHIDLFLVGTCRLGCWKETRVFLREIKKREPTFDKRYNNNDKYQQAIALLSDPENTARRLTETRPHLRTEGEKTFENLERIFSEARRDKKAFITSHYKQLLHKARKQVSSEDHARFYEKYADRLETALDHSEAAKTFIALNEQPKAKSAVHRYMSFWEHKEPYQVAPIVLFADYELWPIMSDQHFTESLLSIPHNREA